MPKVLSDDTIRRRDVRVKLEWTDIKPLLAKAAMEDCDISGEPFVDGVLADVELKQEERGSPSYRIGEWSAIVKLTLPLDRLD